ncbi:GGDEF domain-containing protein [Planococcus lenghuensis]|uniref:GGDEF domain-containing protein n=1 Tax=Planococcus lenghuensis TaxID=2213202 RepID=A0A1Q2L306_9BACL|nr:GGDEF domain-containing protein [Planococcus lenghuensis]AQQ54744.1 hypothetical protein B0X71_17635 [Planococcus lenghuensis]
MKKSYSFFLFIIYLLTGIGTALLLLVCISWLTDMQLGSRESLLGASIGVGLLLGSVNFVIFHFFVQHLAKHFRSVLQQVREGDFSARTSLKSYDVIGELADDVNKAIELLEKTKTQIQCDDLTGLPNRQYLHEYFIKNRERTAPGKMAFLFFDLDKFKQINDRFGHDIGDQVLIEVGKRVQDSLEEGEALVRLSGDEFLLVSPLRNEGDIPQLANRLTRQFQKPFQIGQVRIPVNLSIGVSVYPNHGTELTELLKKADFAMYEAKNNHRHQYRLYREQMLKTSKLSNY